MIKSCTGPVQCPMIDTLKKNIIFKNEYISGTCRQPLLQTVQVGFEDTLLPVLRMPDNNNKFQPLKQADSGKLFSCLLPSVPAVVNGDAVNFVKKGPGVFSVFNWLLHCAGLVICLLGTCLCGSCNSGQARIPFIVLPPGSFALLRKYIVKIADTDFVRSTIEERADLSAFKEKPTLMVLAGVFAIAASFVMGWPAIAALGYISVKLENPWIAVVGGPLTYGLSHLIFIFGMYLSGATYSIIFLRWLTRVSVEKLLAWTGAEDNDAS